MSYMQEFEAELKAKLQASPDDASLIKWVSEKVPESYKNGIRAGQKGTKIIRDGKSRTRGPVGVVEGLN